MSWMACNVDSVFDARVKYLMIWDQDKGVLLHSHGFHIAKHLLRVTELCSFNENLNSGSIVCTFLFKLFTCYLFLWKNFPSLFHGNFFCKISPLAKLGFFCDWTGGLLNAQWFLSVASNLNKLFFSISPKPRLYKE